MLSSSKPVDSVQSWLPIEDIDDYTMIRRDKYVVTGIRVNPANIDLLSPRERKALVQNLREIVNGQATHYQFFCVGRPVDLDGYIAHLEQIKANTQNPIRKKIVSSQIRQAAQTAISGEALETMFFILFASLNKSELLENTKQILIEMKEKGLNGYILDHKELMDMNFVFTHPVIAAFERVPDNAKEFIPPTLLNPERVKFHV